MGHRIEGLLSDRWKEDWPRSNRIVVDPVNRFKKGR